MTNIIKRSEARAAGDLHYFTGAPCKYGHISIRLVSTGNCTECLKIRRLSSSEMTKRAEYQKRPEVLARNRERAKENYRKDGHIERLNEWRKNNAGKLKEYRDRYYKNENARAKRREYDKSPERMAKRREYQLRPEVKARRQELKLSDSYKKKRSERYRSNEYKLIASERRKTEEWKRLNREASRKRQVKKLNRIPKWFGELDKFVWSEAASLVGLRNKITSTKWEADHMEPMQGEDISGLHVWNNCQVIPKSINAAKRNKRQFTTAGDWIRCL